MLVSSGSIIVVAITGRRYTYRPIMQSDICGHAPMWLMQWNEEATMTFFLVIVNQVEKNALKLNEEGSVSTA